MARIRTIKPSFFRHGGLQDIEEANPGKHCMLVFAGLWGHCDRTGVFECDPRQLKLDILPFLTFDMEETISLLESHGFLRRYEVNGKQYAVIPSFSDHQRVSGKEAQEPLRHPREADGKQQGSTREETVKKLGSDGEATVKHLPGQEVEGNGVQEGKGDKALARKRALPTGFAISPRVKTWASSKGFDKHLEAHFEKFMGHVKANAPKYADWDEALMNCIRDDWGDVRRKANGGKPDSVQPPRIQCGNCSKPLGGSWTESPKGKVCDSCHRAYMNGGWPERVAA